MEIKLMNSFRKIAITGLFAISASLAGQAAASNTEAKVTVVNQTSETAVFGYEYFSGSVSSTPTAIEKGTTANFTLTSVSNWASGMRFTYTAGRKKCRFEASHSARLLLGRAIPNWKKNAASIGPGRANCTVTVTQASPNDPFNYSVKFTIQ
jgi:hypothetical protein